MGRRPNHLGLYSEQFDPATGAFPGNFPRASTHIGPVNSALYTTYTQGWAIPGDAPIGTPEHRAELEGGRIQKVPV